MVFLLPSQSFHCDALLVTEHSTRSSPVLLDHRESYSSCMPSDRQQDARKRRPRRRHFQEQAL